MRAPRAEELKCEFREPGRAFKCEQTGSRRMRRKGIFWAWFVALGKDRIRIVAGGTESLDLLETLQESEHPSYGRPYFPTMEV
jgi:hypothetical protein